MVVANPPKRAYPAILITCFVLVSVVGTAVPVRSASATGLRLAPASIQVVEGQTLVLAIWVDDVENLYRVELHLNYDQAGLEVQDADPGHASVQIEPGPVFCDTCAPWNEAVGGRINFVAQREPAEGSFSGSGVVAYVTLRITAIEPDTYTISFDQTMTGVLDDAGDPIAVDQFTNAAITLPPPLVTLTGWMTREGWGSDDRSVVNAVLYPVASPYEPISWGRACTDEVGDFILRLADNPQPPPAGILPPGDPPTSTACTNRWAFMRLDFTNYLSECYWECADGDLRDIGWHDLEGGDVNGDGCINILDVVGIIGDFGDVVDTPCYISCPECPADSALSNVAPSYDVNGDCRVNILDLTQAAGNFGLCSNCP
jgi:hypothetical protein